MSTVVPAFYGRRMSLFLDETVATEPGSAPGPEPVVTPATGGQRSFDDLGEPLREVTFVVVDLETTGGSAATDAITEIGAVKVRGGQGAGRVRHPGGSGPQHSAADHDADRDHRFDGVRRTPDRGCAADSSWSSSAARWWSRTMPGSTSVFCVRRACGSSLAGARGGGHGAAGPHGAAPRRGAERALVRARPVAGRPDAARPSGVARRPGHGRRAARAVRASGFAGCAQPVRVARRHADVAPSGGANGGWPTICRPRRGCTCSVDHARRCSTSARRATCVSGSAPYFSASEQRRRINQMVGLAIRVDHVECAHALEAHIREQRHRRTSAAVQPAVAPPRRGVLGGVDG